MKVKRITILLNTLKSLETLIHLIGAQEDCPSENEKELFTFLAWAISFLYDQFLADKNISKGSSRGGDPEENQAPQCCPGMSRKSSTCNCSKGIQWNKPQDYW